MRSSAALLAGVAVACVISAAHAAEPTAPPSDVTAGPENEAAGDPDVVLPARTSLTNAGVKLALSDGDVARVMDLHGSPTDVIGAMRSRLANDPGAVVDPDNARPVPLSRWLASIDQSLSAGEIPQFIQDNGRTKLAFFNAAGQLISVTVVPGMNTIGRAPVGIPFSVPIPTPPPPLPAFGAPVSPN